MGEKSGEGKELGLEGESEALKVLHCEITITIVCKVAMALMMSIGVKSNVPVSGSDI